MKKLLAILLVLLFMLACEGSVLAFDEIQILIDGSPLTLDVAPRNYNGRILVPLRAIFEEMGASIIWDANTQTVTAIDADTNVTLTIGDTSPTVNGQVIPIDQSGIIIEGRTLAPLRFVAEAFGGTVEWDGYNNIARITRNNIDIFDSIVPGRDVLIVPDVVGKTQSEAEQILLDSGFGFSVIFVYSDTETIGTVIIQNFPPEGLGRLQKKNSVIEIGVCAGKDLAIK